MKKKTQKRATADFGMVDSSGGIAYGDAVGTGAGLGALIGALRAPKGKMLKYTLGGAGVGGLAGAGGAAAYNLVPEGATPEEKMFRLPLAIGGGALAGHLGGKLYDEVEHHIPEKKDKSMKKKTEKKSAALAFGEKCAAGFDMNNPMLRTGLGGAALGAVGGGLAGLMAPGRDEEGRRRNRFGSALRGALGGGAVGGLGGVALESYMPGAGNDVEQYVRGLVGRQRPAPVTTNMNAATQALKADPITGQRFRKYMEQFPNVVDEAAGLRDRQQAILDSEARYGRLTRVPPDNSLVTQEQFLRELDQTN